MRTCCVLVQTVAHISKGLPGHGNALHSTVINQCVVLPRRPACHQVTAAWHAALHGVLRRMAMLHGAANPVP